MQTILNNKKSTYGNPYCYHTVKIDEITNRTATEVELPIHIISHLANSSSIFGTGGNRYLKAQLYINGAWSEEITLKTTSQSWSGTTEHTKTVTLTISGLNATDAELTNIKFKVKSGASDQSCGLDSTACSNITIPMGHQVPDIINYSMAESNNDLINIQDIDEVIVENLSIKKFTINCTLHDNATISRVGIYNNIYPFSTSTFTIKDHSGDNWTVEFELDCSQFSFVKDDNDNTKIPIVTRVIDSFETQGVSSSLSQSDLYSYIPYTTPTIIESNVITKRAGQITGNATLSLEGTYYYSNDTLNQSNHITVSYKYWENKENPEIPINYTNIPGASVTINNDGTFSVSGYNMGNDFDPEKSYRVLVKVSDSYNSYELSEPKSVPVGEALWTEYKDRVDFKKLTIKDNDIYNELFHSVNDILELGSNSGDGRYCVNGFITVSTTTLLFNIHTDKSMKDINTITCQELNVESRGVSGYLNNTSGYIDYVGLSDYTINCYKVDNHNIRIAVKKSTAFTNTSNNTPISLNGYFKFELSYIQSQ